MRKSRSFSVFEVRFHVVRVPSSPKLTPLIIGMIRPMLARSRVIPMKTKSGTATKVSLVIMPKIRVGSAVRNAASKVPASMPLNAKISAVPPRAKATGKPVSKKQTTHINKINGTQSINQEPFSVKKARKAIDVLWSNSMVGMISKLVLSSGING